MITNFDNHFFNVAYFDMHVEIREILDIDRLKYYFFNNLEIFDRLMKSKTLRTFELEDLKTKIRV